MSSQYGELRPTSGWDRFVSLGTPANFNGFRSLASLLQWYCSTEANETLHDVWPSPGLVHYIYSFGGSLPRNGILPGAKFTLRPSLVLSYIGSVTALHWSSGRQPNFSALSRGRHLYLAGWPSRWALAHILVSFLFCCLLLCIAEMLLCIALLTYYFEKDRVARTTTPEVDWRVDVRLGFERFLKRKKKCDVVHCHKGYIVNKFFFRIVDTCLSSEDRARQSCAMVPKWLFFASWISSELRAAHFRPAF